VRRQGGEIIPQRSDNGGDAVHHPDALRRA